MLTLLRVVQREDDASSLPHPCAEHTQQGPGVSTDAGPGAGLRLLHVPAPQRRLHPVHHQAECQRHAGLLLHEPGVRCELCVMEAPLDIKFRSCRLPAYP